MESTVGDEWGRDVENHGENTTHQHRNWKEITLSIVTVVGPIPGRGLPGTLRMSTRTGGCTGTERSYAKVHHD